MKRVSILILIFMVTFMSGCTGGGKPKETVNEPTQQSLKKTSILWGEFPNNWMQINIPKVGLKNLQLGELAEGKITKNNLEMDTKSRVYILCDNTGYDGSNSTLCHPSYLAVEAETKVLFKALNESHGEELYLRDIDGDKLDEIIIQQGISGNSGSFTSFSSIFKVGRNEIKKIYYNSNYDDNNYGELAAGFSGIPKDGFKIEISNKFTGYKKTIDYTNTYDKFKEAGEKNNVFNKNGKVISDWKVEFGGFYTFEPKDIDDDGVYEIVCEQRGELNNVIDHIGYAKSVLKFNPKTQKFKVIKAEFIQWKGPLIF